MPDAPVWLIDRPIYGAVIDAEYVCAAQVHEWGGVFTDIVTYSHFRQFRPGLRIAINSHGGHYWSTQVPHQHRHARMLVP